MAPHCIFNYCVVWDGFLFKSFHAASGQGAPAAVALLPFIHVIVGAAITYFTAASIVNTTFIEVGQGTCECSWLLLE